MQKTAERPVEFRFGDGDRQFEGTLDKEILRTGSHQPFEYGNLRFSAGGQLHDLTDCRAADRRRLIN